MKKKKTNDKPGSYPDMDMKASGAFVSFKVKYNLDPFEFSIHDNTDEVRKELEAKSKDKSSEDTPAGTPVIRGEFKPCDDKTFQNLLNLIDFVKFVGEQPELDKKSIPLIQDVIGYIENLNSTEPNQDWMVSIWMINYRAKSEAPKGIRVKNWFVSYEQNVLNVEAETNHEDDPINHWGSDFNCYGTVYFRDAGDELSQRVYLEDDLAEFVADARKFRTYMVGMDPEILVEIDVWNINRKN